MRTVRVATVWLVMVVAAAMVVAGCGSGSSSGPGDSAAASTLALPSDFPKAQVPLADGALLSAGGSADEGWNLTLQAPADAAAGLDGAVRTLTDAGFRVAQRSTEGGNQVVVLTGNGYTVQVGSVAGAAGGQNSVFYQVARS